ncbi:MAG: NifB/NifX family molybdenum-iron cluster-binding protein [Bacillota bacterium]|nr:NifB/NifX family molybdenum-iron cluster-binding protein [Bacillota bacterium]
MKAAFAVSEEGLEALVESRFGRSPRFTIVDLESGEHETIQGPGAAATGGAGVATAQALANRGVEAVVAGNLGPNACAVLQAAGIDCYQAAGRTVAQTVELLRQGQLTATGSPTVPGHFGLRSGGLPTRGLPTRGLPTEGLPTGGVSGGGQGGGARGGGQRGGRRGGLA